MQFYTFAFIFFLAAALVAYYAVGRLLGRGQWIVLLVASMVFYVSTGFQNLAFIGTTALTTWLGSLAFARLDARSKQERKAADSREQKKAIKAAFVRKKRLVLLVVLLLNFGILSYLKYAEVLVGYLMPDSAWSPGILLPLGISFYTFQSVSYLVDTYGAKYEPERNFARYLLFVSFFPQLVQGPINRFNLMVTQLYERHRFNLRESRGALLQIGYGMLKKYAIADLLLGTVTAVTTNIDAGTPGSAIVFGILAYSAYSYADFSGGIDMVLGFARLFGIQMSPNFRQPYFSVSLADFWRRWHITLGAWMRDYVFYPFALLPGVQRWGKRLAERFGKHIGRALPACTANILVFFIVGLWHGAESHFILWGLYNGLVIAASDLVAPAFDKMKAACKVNAESAVYHVFAIVRTFVVVNIGWYFDAFTRFGDCVMAFKNTLFNFNAAGLADALDLLLPEWTFLHCYPIAGVSIVAVFVVSVLKERGVDVESKVLALPAVVRALMYVVFGVLVLHAMNYGSAEGFMYANF